MISSEPPAPSIAFSCCRWIAGASVAVALLLSVLLVLHVRPFNGPSYFPWAWGRNLLVPTAGISILVVVQILLLHVLVQKRPPLVWTLILLTAGSFALKTGFSVLQSEPYGLSLARETVRNPTVGGFFTVATALRESEWVMEDYAQLMPQFPLHALNKPPGPAMFWLAMLESTSSSEAALTLGMVLIGIISSLAPPLMLLWAYQLGASPAASICAGGFLSLATGSIAFYPLFDPAYTSVALLLLILWTGALILRSLMLSCVLGLCLAGTLFVSFHILPIGWVMAGLAIVMTDGAWIDRVKFSGRLALTTLVACVFGLAMLRFFAGYDVTSVFSAALESQRDIMAVHGATHRPYPATIGWDLYDYSLGIAFVPLLPAGAFLFSRGDASRRIRHLGWCGIALLAFIALTALLPGESARVWNFLFPLVALPAGMWVAECVPRSRLAIFTATGCAVVATLHALVFVSFDSLIIR